MEYVPIHTNVYPNYNYLSAENAFLRQNIEYKNAVLCEKQAEVDQLKADVDSLSQASVTFKQERDKAVLDASRWRVMQQIIRTQGGDKQLYEVQKTVDKELERERAGQSLLNPKETK